MNAPTTINHQTIYLSNLLSQTESDGVVITNFTGRLLTDALRNIQTASQSNFLCLVFSEDIAQIRQDMERTISESLGGNICFFHGSITDLCRTMPITFEGACLSVEKHEEISIHLSNLQRALAKGAPVMFTAERPEIISAWDNENLTSNFSTIAHDGASLTIQNKSVREQDANTREIHFESLIQIRPLLHDRYMRNMDFDNSEHTPIADLAIPYLGKIRKEGFTRKVNLGCWPYINPEPHYLPGALPNGRPWPKISVVTPSFNQGKYIEETILSVVRQNYPNLEYIIIDGGSTDETQEVVNRYGEQVHYFVSEADHGQSHAINKGMKRATGDILTWLNSDDMLAPGALCAMAMAFHTSQADLIAGACSLYRNDKNIGHHLTCCGDEPLPLEDILDLDHGWNAGHFFYQPEVMFTRALWEKAGGYVREDLFYSMDYELWLRFAENGAKLHVIGRPICWFRLHDEQKTHVAQNFKSELKEFRQHYLVEKKRPPPPERPVISRKAGQKIVMLNDIGFQYGAGIAHERIAKALSWTGYEISSVHLVERAMFADGALPLPSFDQIVAEIARHEPDLIIVGNLHAARVDPWLIKLISERWPVMIVMHDYWWLTGRCAYTEGCEKFLEGCDNQCPTSSDYPKLNPERINEYWREKRVILNAQKAPILVANSRWVEGFIEHTFAYSKNDAPSPLVTRIQLGIPTDIFRPQDMGVCRDRFGIPLDKFVIMIGASNVDDPRKGVSDIVEALNMLQLPNYIVVAAGWANPNSSALIPNLHAVGYLEDEEAMAALYGAADIFVGASSEETFGQVFAEAAACGAPVVAYDANGMQDAVQDGVTGLTCPPSDPAELAACIAQLYHAPDLRADMRIYARLYAENEFSMMRCSYSFFRAFRKAGIIDQIGAIDKISFLPSAPKVTPSRIIGDGFTWEPVYGFGPKEGPHQEYELESFFWLEGPIGEINLRPQNPSTEKCLLKLNLRNNLKNQDITLILNGQEIIATQPIEKCELKHEQVLFVEVILEKKFNSLIIQAKKWRQYSSDDRLLALIITDISLVPNT